MTVKVLNDTLVGFYDDWIDGIAYAVNNGADVINLSLGDTDVSQALEDAIEDAVNDGVVIVAAMSNDDVGWAGRHYPAAYDGVIAVGATSPDDSRASNFLFYNNGEGVIMTHILMLLHLEMVFFH